MSHKYNIPGIRIICILFLLLTSAVSAQNPASLKGKVTDSETGEALAGANVMIINTTIGATTDSEGIFLISKYPEKEFTLQVSMIGYRSQTRNLTGGRIPEGIMNFELTGSLIELGSVVVTGTNSTHLYEDVPVKTELVTKKLIKQQAACNLSQALGLQTGVMVENDCNNCNFTQVRILGFDGKYSQILIDGDPVVSSLGGVYGLEHYPQEMIEQIEIIKGGGSSMYGGGAVAGTINMMTRRPAFNNTRVGYSGSSTGNSYDQQIGAVAEMVNDRSTAGLFVFGSTRYRTPHDENGDTFSELGKLENETLGVNSYFRPTGNSELRVNFHRIYEERRGGNDFDVPVHEAQISEWTKHLKWGGKIRWEQKLGSGFRYKIHYAFSLLERDSYYGGLAEDTPEARLEALNYYGYSENPLHTYGARVNYNLDNHNFSAGMEQTFDKLLDKSVSSDAYYLDEEHNNLGFYLQDELFIGKNRELILVAGGRMDKHSLLESWIFSPRLNAKYQVLEALKVRGGYTTGFKAPQVFDEDLHICGLEGTQRVIRNSAGLKEERSSTYTLGFEFLDFVGPTPVLFGVTGFYTNLNDAYTDEFVRSDGKLEIWKRINSAGATVKGIELDLGVKPSSHLELRSGITIKDNEYEENHSDFDTKNFLRTPDVFGYARVSYEFENGLSLFSSVKYTGSMYVPHELSIENSDEPVLELNKSEEFYEFDFSASKEISLFSDIKSVISVGVKNIFNAYQSDLDYGPQRDPAYVYGPSQPRTYFFNVDLNL